MTGNTKRVSGLSVTDSGMKSLLTPQATPIVFVVDDDISVRESLQALILFEGWQPETFGSAGEFLAHPRVSVPSCLVLDVSLPDLNGLDLQKCIAQEQHDMPIIFITGYGDVPMSVRAMKAGAQEFLTKPFSDEVLVNAIRQALEHSRVALARELEMKTLRDCYASLTGRERQVMLLVVSGLSNRKVGNELGITEVTVKAHRGRVMEKMKVGSIADLVKIAAKLTSHALPAQTVARTRSRF
jgi:FixJ family two-component response regulator